MKNNQKGITLVALVITIIVLLILAGVTIAALSGDNGILSNASKSKQENAVGQAKDLVAMAINEATNAYYSYTYANGTLPEGTTEGKVTRLQTAIAYVNAIPDPTGITISAGTVETESPSSESTVTIKVNDKDVKTVTGTIDVNGGLHCN